MSDRSVKTKTEDITAGCVFALALFVAFIVFLLLLIPPASAAYDGGYPAPVTPTLDAYPAPVDPMCEEWALMGKNLPWWCPVIGEAVSTVASEPQPTETPAAIVKVGGRQKMQKGIEK